MPADTGMLIAIQDDLLNQLGAISQVNTIDVWQGDIEDLLKMPQKLPALNIIYQGGKYQPFDQIGQSTSQSMDYLIVLIVRHNKSRKEGLLAAYEIIDEVRAALTGHWIGGIEGNYDFWRPREESLIIADGGMLVYGLVYGLDMVEVHTD
jgi:hypothetical protein